MRILLPRTVASLSSIPQPGHLLVVDDNRDYADSVRELVEISSQWKAEAAYGVTDAIKKAKVRRPDAVLLDLEMPPYGGLQAVDAFEQAFPHDLPKIVAVSGNAHLVDAASNDRRLLGASLKPVDPSLLVRWLAEIAASCELSRALSHPSEHREGK